MSNEMRKNMSSVKIKQYIDEIEEKILLKINSSYPSITENIIKNAIYRIPEDEIQIDKLTEDDILNILERYAKVINLKNCDRIADTYFTFIDFYIYKYWDGQSELPPILFVNNSRININHSITCKKITSSIFFKENDIYKSMKIFIKEIGLLNYDKKYIKDILIEEKNHNRLLSICNFIIDKINTDTLSQLYNNYLDNNYYLRLKFKLLNYYFYIYTEIINLGMDNKFCFCNYILELGCKIFKNEFEKYAKNENIYLNCDIIKKNITNGQRKCLEFILNRNIERENIFTKLVGITYYNDDGKLRKDILSKMVGDTSVDLIRELYNEYDTNAIAVYSGNDKLGYVPSNIASGLAKKIDDGYRTTTYLKVSIMSDDGEFINDYHDITSINDVYISAKLEITIDKSEPYKLPF